MCTCSILYMRDWICENGPNPAFLIFANFHAIYAKANITPSCIWIAYVCSKRYISKLPMRAGLIRAA